MNATYLIDAAGWTLVHFLWQGAVAALVLTVFLRILRSAGTRYVAATVALAFLVLTAAGTFFLVVSTGADSSNVKEPVRTALQVPLVDSVPRTVDAPTNERVGVTTPSTAKPLTDQVTRTEPRQSITSFPWQKWAVAIWLSGVVFFALRFLFDWRASRSLRKYATPLMASETVLWLERFAELKRRIGVSRPVAFLTSAATQVPAVLGVFRPVVILPASMLTRLPPAQVEAILLHELAHIRRHDFLVNLLQTLAETLFFFHPAMWWISGKIRVERENCCDDIAAANCEDVRIYAGALAALEESRTDASAPGLAMAANGGKNGGHLLKRIRRLARSDRSINRASIGWPSALLGFVAVAGSVFLALTMFGQAEGKEGATKNHATDWSQLKVSHFGDKNRELVCIHTGDDIQAVVILSKPENALVQSSEAGVRRQGKTEFTHHAYADFQWNGQRFRIQFDSDRPDEIRLNQRIIHLTGGRVIFHDPVTDRAVQSHAVEDNQLPKLKLHPDTAPLLTKLRSRMLSTFAAQPETARLIRRGFDGTVALADGFTLEIRNQVYHGADVTTWGTLGGPVNGSEFDDAKGHRIDIAQDYFANRQPWAAVWRNDAPVLWIAAGRHVPPGQPVSREKFAVEHLRRIDFSDPSEIVHYQFAGLPDDPSHAVPETVRAALARVAEMPADGSFQYRLTHFVSPKTDSSQHGITVYQKTDNQFVIATGPEPEDERPATSDGLAARIRAASEKLAAKNPDTGPDSISLTLCSYAKCSAPAIDKAVAILRGVFSKLSAADPEPIIVTLSRDGKIDKHAALPFGPANDDGLRVARLFEPMRETYELGAQVDGRIVFYNSGKEPIAFSTEDWHQRDTWHCRKTDGTKVQPEIYERMGFRGWLSITLHPGQVCEVAAQGTAIGSVPYDDEPGRVFWTSRIPAQPGDDIVCSWDVTYTPNGTKQEQKLRTGEIPFRVMERSADFPVNLGIALKLGKYHLAEGIKLQRSRGKETTATIEWEDGSRHKLLLARHDSHADPLEPIVWQRGGSAFWIVGEKQLRRIDFTDPNDVKETTWSWNDAPSDFGSAPELVRRELEKLQPKPVTYRNRPVEEWDAMLGPRGVRSEHRPALQKLGYGKLDIPVPNEAIPMILALVKSGNPATRCRCLGILRKVKDPSDKVLDTVIATVNSSEESGNPFRAGYLLGRFPDRAGYIVPRLNILLKRENFANRSVVHALGRFGPAARGAVPAIEALRPGADDSLFHTINEALRSIRGESKESKDSGNETTSSYPE